jgi:hypothetical protein
MEETPKLSMFCIDSRTTDENRNILKLVYFAYCIPYSRMGSPSGEIHTPKQDIYHPKENVLE